MPVKIICGKTGEPVAFKFIKEPSRMKCPSCGFGHFLTAEMINMVPGRGVETPRLRAEPVSEEGSWNDPARGVVHKEWLLPGRGGLDMGKLADAAHQALESARTECEWLANWKLVWKVSQTAWPRAASRPTSGRVARFLYLCGAGRGARTDLTVVRDPRGAEERKLRVEALIMPENRLSRVTRLVYLLLLLVTLGVWGFIGYQYWMSSKAGEIAPSFTAAWAARVPEFIPGAVRPHVAAGVVAVAPLVVMMLVAMGVGIAARISGSHELGPLESHSVADAFVPVFEALLVGAWSRTAEEG